MGYLSQSDSNPNHLVPCFFSFYNSNLRFPQVEMPGQKLHQQFVGLPFNRRGIEIDLEYIAFLFYLVPLGPGDYPYLNSFRQWLLLS